LGIALIDGRLASVHPLFGRAVTLWVPIAVAVTGLTAVVYGAVQQDLRQGANDPQIQMAEDAAARLNAGAPPDAVVPAESIDLAGTLRPYVMVFDGSGHLVASSAQLNGQAPPFPPSVFDQVRNGGQDRITWQPAPGVRGAVVVQPWRDGFVVVGRSLRLVEERVDHIFLLTGFVWLVTLGGTAVAALVVAAVYDLPLLKLT
jgi:hypothetical protein